MEWRHTNKKKSKIKRTHYKAENWARVIRYCIDKRERFNNCAVFIFSIPLLYFCWFFSLSFSLLFFVWMVENRRIRYILHMQYSQIYDLFLKLLIFFSRFPFRFISCSGWKYRFLFNLKPKCWENVCVVKHVKMLTDFFYLPGSSIKTRARSSSF